MTATAYEYVSGSAAAGAYAGNTGDAIRLSPEVSQQIYMVEPADTPLDTLLGMLGQDSPTGSPTYHTQVEWPINYILQGTATETSSDVTVAFADTSFLIPTMVIQNQRTGEQMYVTAVGSSTSATCRRGIGTTPAAACVATDVYTIIGNAVEEGADAIQNLARASGHHTNYAQMFEAKNGITDISMRQTVYGPKEEVRLNEQKISQFRKYKNRSFMTGEPYAGTPTGATLPVYITGGARYWAKLYNNITMPGGFTYKTLSAALKACLRYGGQGERWAFVSHRLWAEISSMLQDKVQVGQSENSIGMEITRIQVPGGVINLTADYLMDEAGFDDEMLVLDMRYVGTRTFEGYTAEPNIQTLGSHRRESHIYQRTGFEQRLPISSALITGLEYAA